MHNFQMGLPLDPSIYIDIFIMEVSLRPFVIFGDIRKPRRDVAHPLAHPWAGCLTEILSYVVPFEKFSWCIRSEDLCINDIAVYKNNRILLFRMEKISCYFIILLVS